MHFKIKKSLLPVCEPKYLHCIIIHKSGVKHESVCLMGQILEQLGHNLFRKVKGSLVPIQRPSELNKILAPFTRFVRGKSIESDLAISIMQVPYPLPPGSIEKVAVLLQPWNHTIELVD